MVEQPSFSFGALEAADDTVAGTLTVTQLASSIRDALRHGFPEEVWVRGEVQGLTRSQPGHTYFSLVERDDRRHRARASIDVVLFRDDRRRVERALRDVPGAELANDVEVRIRGRVAIYPESGRLQLVMSALDPLFTVGGLAANRERILRTLANDGLLDRNGSLPLADVPLRVGLVTSHESAAYHDFVDELARSGFAWRVALANVRVQGASASAHLVRALHSLSVAPVDVVVVVRGGGSRADLAAFDTDAVARAVATMPVPVFTGVGHEIDRSVVDEVAHTACKTPTACAHALVTHVRSFLDRLDERAGRVVGAARARGALADRELEEAVRRLQRSAPAALGRETSRVERAHGRAQELGRLRTRDAARRLDTAATSVRHRAVHRATVATMTLDATRASMLSAAERGLARTELALDSSSARVALLDPRRVLQRGYTITRARNGSGEERVVKRAAEVRAGDRLATQFADGTAVSTVEPSDESGNA